MSVDRVGDDDMARPQWRCRRVASAFILLVVGIQLIWFLLEQDARFVSQLSLSSETVVKLPDDDAANDTNEATYSEYVNGETKKKKIKNNLQTAQLNQNNTAVSNDLLATSHTTIGGDGIASPSSFSLQHRLTVVTQLSGELGNHISKLATGVALALEWQQRVSSLSSQSSRNSNNHQNDECKVDLLLRHQEHPKWVRAAAQFQACFPVLASYNISAANTRHFDERQKQQQLYRVSYELSSSVGDVATTPTSLAKVLDGINTESGNEHANRVDQTLNWLLQHWEELSSSRKDDSNLATVRGDDGGEDEASISFPFLYANHLTGQDAFLDRHYTAFRRFFAWDYNRSECCSTRPYSDETVFHFRNFLTEMPRKGLQKGYQELGPNQVAHELLGHLQAGDKVAILTRFPDQPIVQDYVGALRARGLQVRLIGRAMNATDQAHTATTSALHDFCFLQSAQKEVVGLARSTFFYWAGILGRAQTVRAYSVDSPAKRQSHTPLLDAYNWTHPELRKRVVFELYKVNE